MINFSKYFVSLAGIGFSPLAPGTLGSITAIIIWYIFISFLNISYFYIFFTIICFTSFYLTNLYLNETKKDDPSEVVIDELIGQSIPLLFLFEFNLFEVLIAFSAFRFFDIYKVYPINKAEEIQGSMGVILDDIIAGIYALVIVMSYKITFILI